MNSNNKAGHLSPTNLATFHYNHCELYLWNAYNSQHTDIKGSSNPNPLTNAQFERGVDWEDSIVSWLDAQGLLLSLSGPILTGDNIVSILQLEDRERFFVYGLKFQSPSFEEEFDKRLNGSRVVNFGVAKPDLVEFRRSADNRLTWKVIDAKASKKAKVEIRSYVAHEKILKVSKDFPPCPDLLVPSMS